MTRGEAFKHVHKRLESADIDGALREARTLLAAVLDCETVDIILASRDAVSPEQMQKLDLWLDRRCAHEPLARLRGSREFWGLPFILNEETLEPRFDSETLIALITRLYPDRALPLRILDIGTGTGCLLLSLLHEYKEASGIGTDCSDRALDAAVANAAALDQDERAAFLHTSWTEGCEGPFDIIVSNPPYIASDVIPTLGKEVRDFDPIAALDGGFDGLDAYRTLIPEAYELLETDGFLAMEIGYDQPVTVKAMFEAQGFRDVRMTRDIGTRPRVISGWK
jgi:release factor glutamine methyltransferase